MIDYRIFVEEYEEDGYTYGGEMFYSEELDIKRSKAFGFNTDCPPDNEDCIFMLYVLKEDREGEKIYVGDELSIKGTDIIYEVKFDKHELRYVAVSKQGYMLLGSRFNLAKVEGNIYEKD